MARIVNVGVTGTRYGMNDRQKIRFRSLMLHLCPLALNHGDCVGVDSEVHEIAVGMGIDVYLHPPINPKLRAFCQGYMSSEEPKEYFERNRCIVSSSGVIIGVPSTDYDTGRGGTWYTINYALSKGLPVAIVYPDIKTQYCNWRLPWV